jgi:hypothetical protein
VWNHYNNLDEHFDEHFDYDSHNLNVDEHNLDEHFDEYNLDVDDACALHHSTLHRVRMWERPIVFLHCERLLSGC